MNGARLLMGFSVTMNLIENPLSDEKPSLKWDATVFLKTRKTNILMYRRQIAQYHGKVSSKMLSEWNILVLTNAYNELIDLQMKKTKGR